MLRINPLFLANPDKGSNSVEQAADDIRLVVAMTGATGAVYGVRLLEVLTDTRVETHLIMSDWARKTILAETGRKPEQAIASAHRSYSPGNQAARLSSGSFITGGMVIVPCSMKTLAAIANGYSENLIHRAADVTIKEQRKLVLVVRESPLSAIHLENMLKLTRIGVTIMPPVPSFYARPKSIEEMIDHTVGRVLDQFGLERNLVRRWGETRDASWPNYLAGQQKRLRD